MKTDIRKTLRYKIVKWSLVISIASVVVLSAWVIGETFALNKH